jgi:hypothetical protein
MITGNTISMELLGKSSGTVDYYCQVPYRCTIRTVRANCHVDPGDSETITLAWGSYTLGSMAMGSSLSAGSAGTWTEDASSGNTVISANGAIKVTTSAFSAVGTGSTIHLEIELDPHALTDDDFA